MAERTNENDSELVGENDTRDESQLDHEQPFADDLDQDVSMTRDSGEFDSDSSFAEDEEAVDSG